MNRKYHDSLGHSFDPHCARLTKIHISVGRRIL